jgi:hypothetical protein
MTQRSAVTWLVSPAKMKSSRDDVEPLPPVPATMPAVWKARGSGGLPPTVTAVHVSLSARDSRTTR